MSRVFVGASSEYLEIGAAALTAFPCTVAARFRNSATTQSIPFFLGDKDATAGRLFVDTHNSTFRAYTDSSTGNCARAASSDTYSANVWYSGVAVFNSALSLSAHLDGGNSDAAVTSGTGGSIANADRMAIGALRDSTPTYGSATLTVAEIALWNVALTAGERSALADRVCPLLVRPGNLVAYWPLGGVYDADDGDHDVVGGHTMAPYNTPSTADHPGGLVYPSAGIVAPTLAISPVRPWYYYRRNRMGRAM